MSWSKDDKEGPRGYHHGNLKEALIRAALELIAQKGPAGFTFAEAARWAGVSPAAPYRHFRDRDELLANVALRGFEQFEAALARAWDDGRPDAFIALDRLGKAYLDFARTEPAYYSAMFEAGIPAGTNPELREAGDRAFAVLREAAEKLCAQMPRASPASRFDGGAAYLGDGARHRFAVRPGRCGAAHAADVAGGTSRSGGAGLSARSRRAGLELVQRPSGWRDRPNGRLSSFRFTNFESHFLTDQKGDVNVIYIHTWRVPPSWSS